MSEVLMKTAGIHHITCFVKNAQRNVDFYTGVLGLRLVKKTINFDAPEVYHLYFGNEKGSPGTIITFFPYEFSSKGHIGGGQVGTTTYVVPIGAMGFWKSRLAAFHISYTESTRFSESYIQFLDYDGLQLEIVEREGGALNTWSHGDIPADKAIKGFGGAVLYSTASDKTMLTLEEILGLEKVGKDNGFIRFRAEGDLGNLIDVNEESMDWGTPGAGTVHHIAWRAKDWEEHEAWRGHVADNGYHSTPIIDRQYFHAIYFREHGGILFEIATDPPGFANDEPEEHLGEKLMLPSWFEDSRDEIERNLPPIEVQAKGRV
ncbi:ring-cleaving dioxygenase [Paenibacillus glycanilyticus]|uniref:Ring-cleaving dioxygenase MhqO n=1 Tax=Paenibacillus glycanilyticus TaxID=126569 RepID=A0ABQ6GL59_9BACL|nr:ring-cleaving dioxygenase [Paenibacillus glycanilyticus]GLX70988.1 putative ring-cleaving dioxygenase MhqO [Paenibacillus glycanilyticus]